MSFHTKAQGTCILFIWFSRKCILKWRPEESVHFFPESSPYVLKKGPCTFIAWNLLFLEINPIWNRFWGPLSANPVQGMNSVVTAPADRLAPNGARPSAGTVLTKKLRHVLFQVSPAFDDFVTLFMDWWHNPKWTSKSREISPGTSRIN